MAENAIVLYFSTKPAAQPVYDDNAQRGLGKMVDDDYWFQQVAWSATVYSQPAVYDEPELSINEVNAGAAGGTQLVFSISVRPAQQPYADDEQIPVQYGLTDYFYILRFRPAGPKAMPPTVVQAEDDLPPQTHFGLEDEFHLGQLLYWVRPPAAQQPAGDDGDLGHPNIEDDTAPPSMLVALVAPTLPVLYQLEDDLPRNIAAHPLDDDINDLSLRIVLPYAAMPQPFASNEETVRTIKVDEDYSYRAIPSLWPLWQQPMGDTSADEWVPPASVHINLLTWTPATISGSTVTAYVLYRSENGGPFEQIAVLQGTSSEYADVVTQTGIALPTYSYYLIAQAAIGSVSSPSNTVSLTP